MFICLLLLMVLSGNMLLEDAVHRVIDGDTYGEIKLGVFLVRGENISMMGELVCLYISMYLSIISMLFNSYIGMISFHSFSTCYQTIS